MKYNKIGYGQVVSVVDMTRNDPDVEHNVKVYIYLILCTITREVGHTYFKRKSCLFKVNIFLSNGKVPEK